MRTAAAYIRVSTDGQLEYSPDSQLKVIRDYAQKHDFLLPEAYIFPGRGGYQRKGSQKQLAFMRMIGIAKQKPKPFDCIILWKFSRFARSRRDSIVYKTMLRKQLGIDVVSVTEQLGDDKLSLLLEAVIEAMDEYYSINLAEEVKRGMLEKVSRGEPVTPPPFGYRMQEKQYSTRSHYRPHCSVDVPPMRAGGSVQRNRPPAQRHGDSHRTRATLGNARSRLSLAQPRLSGENPLEPPSGDEAIAPRRASPLGWDAPSPSGSLSMGGIPAAIEPKRMQAEQACSSNSLSPAWPCILLHLRRTVGQNLPRRPAMQRLCPRALFCLPLHFHAENGRMDLMHPGSRPPPTCFRKEPLPPRGFFKSISIAT